MAPNRRALQIWKELTNIDARFMMRGRETLRRLEQGDVSFAPELGKALAAIVVSTRHQDRELCFFAQSAGEWSDLRSKPISSFTSAQLAKFFKMASKTFMEADFVAESDWKGKMLSRLGTLTGRLREALSEGIFDSPRCNRHISSLWLSLKNVVWSFPWILEHICSGTLAMLENKSLEHGFLQEDDPAMSARNFASFVLAKQHLKLFSFSSGSHERVVKGFLLREIQSFQPIDLCQSISGLSFCPL